MFEELGGGCVLQHSGEATPANKSHFSFLVDREQKDFKGQLFVYRMKDLGLGANNESTDLVFVEKIESSSAPQ